MAKLDRALHLRNVYLTSQGLEDLRAELNFLKKVKRGEVSERIQRARDLGDLAENAEYEAALDEQALIENRIITLEETLRDAALIKGNESKDLVSIGSTVTVKMGSKTDEYTIVGKVEANPLKKRISNESPLGSVLLGSRVGENLQVKTPITSYSVKILKIR